MLPFTFPNVSHIQLAQVGGSPGSRAGSVARYALRHEFPIAIWVTEALAWSPDGMWLASAGHAIHAAGRDGKTKGV